MVLDKYFAYVEVCTGGGRVQRRPKVIIAHVHVRPVANQEAKQLGTVVDAALGR